MENKLKGENLKRLKKIGNEFWKYPIKLRSTKIKMMAKKKYKDTLFTKLFNNKAAAIQLYNALYRKKLPKNTPVEIVTLDDILFTKRKNDVAFLIDGHFLIFIEHQSTINENMPLRLLLYVVQEYEKLIGYRIVEGKQVSNAALYKKKRIPLPRPEFFVLYNGRENLKEDNTGVVVTEKLMKLSDAFMEDTITIENSLELCVKLIDVRYQSNHESLYQKEKQEYEKKRLSLLGEYSCFISKIEEYKKDNNLEDAIKAASKWCIENDILKEFLLKNETEVMTMLLGVYDEELEKQAIREEIREEERAKADIRVADERAKANIRVADEKAKTLIDISVDFGQSNEEILTILQEKLGIEKKQANKYLKMFYDKTF